MKKLLRVTSQGHHAEAVFVNVDGVWTIESSAPILAWMRSYDMAGIRERLTTQGATWEWLPVDDNYDAGIALWVKGVKGAVKAEQRKAAIVRNVRGKRRGEVTE
jgi:hypothetical protein